MPLETPTDRIREILRLYADHSGLSGREMSLRIGPDNPALLRDILNGRVQSPRLDTVLGIARVVGLPIDELVDLERPLPDFAALARRRALPTVTVPVVRFDRVALALVSDPDESAAALPAGMLADLAGDVLDPVLARAPFSGHGVVSGDWCVLDPTGAAVDGVYLGSSGGRLGFHRDRDGVVLARVAAVVKRL